MLNQELSVSVNYDFIVDTLRKFVDWCLHALLCPDPVEVLRIDQKGKVVKGVARIRHGEYRTRRNILQTDWVVQSRSRQLLPGHAPGIETLAPHDWLVESSGLVAQRNSILVARTLCQHRQGLKTIPVEIYNPCVKPVPLFGKTTPEILSPIPELADVQLDTAPVIPKQGNKVTMRSLTSSLNRHKISSSDLLILGTFFHY